MGYIVSIWILCSLFYLLEREDLINSYVDDVIITGDDIKKGIDE